MTSEDVPCSLDIGSEDVSFDVEEGIQEDIKLELLEVGS